MTSFSMCLEWRLRWLTLCSQSLGWQSFPHSPSWGSILLIKEITTCETLPLQWELVGTRVWRGGRKVTYSNKRCLFIIILNCPKRKLKQSSVLLYSSLSSIVSTAVLSCNKGYSRGLVPGRMWVLRADTGRGRGVTWGPGCTAFIFPIVTWSTEAEWRHEPGDKKLLSLYLPPPLEQLFC